jgi:hypothetical protein
VEYADVLAEDGFDAHTKDGVNFSFSFASLLNGERVCCLDFECRGCGWKELFRFNQSFFL